MRYFSNDGAKLARAGDSPICRNQGDHVRHLARPRGIVSRAEFIAEIHSTAARPLDDGVPPDGIGKVAHNDIRAGRLGELDRFVQIGDEITGPFAPERIRDRCLEAEQRDGADRRLE